MGSMHPWIRLQRGPAAPRDGTRGTGSGQEDGRWLSGGQYSSEAFSPHRHASSAALPLGYMWKQPAFLCGGFVWFSLWGLAAALVATKGSVVFPQLFPGEETRRAGPRNSFEAYVPSALSLFLGLFKNQCQRTLRGRRFSCPLSPSPSKWCKLVDLHPFHDPSHTFAWFLHGHGDFWYSAHTPSCKEVRTLGKFEGFDLHKHPWKIEVQ